MLPKRNVHRSIVDQSVLCIGEPCEQKTERYEYAGAEYVASEVRGLTFGATSIGHAGPADNIEKPGWRNKDGVGVRLDSRGRIAEFGICDGVSKANKLSGVMGRALIESGLRKEHFPQFHQDGAEISRRVERLLHPDDVSHWRSKQSSTMFLRGHVDHDSRRMGLIHMGDITVDITSLGTKEVIYTRTGTLEEQFLFVPPANIFSCISQSLTLRLANGPVRVLAMTDGFHSTNVGPSFVSSIRHTARNPESSAAEVANTINAMLRDVAMADDTTFLVFDM